MQVPNQAEIPDSTRKPGIEEKSDSVEKSDAVEVEKEDEGPSKKSKSQEFETSIPLPFPNRMTQSKKLAEAELDKEIMETFRKVEINIPLLEAVKQVPKYAKFLKDLCTHKRRLKGNEKVSMGRNVSAIIQPSIPPKCKDPGTFTIPCIIGSKQFSQAMLDLGASINVMPKSVYQSLHIGKLKPTGVVIQLANRSTTHPEGVLEDVLVRVNELIFPADFYVLNMEDDMHTNQPTLILGRPFLKTAKTKIDVHSGTLSMEFGDSKVHFNLSDAMKYPPEDHSVFHLDIVDSLVDEVHENLLADFPEILGIGDEFQCADCDGINDLCAVCSEIDACIHGSDLEKSCSADLHVVNDGSDNCDTEKSELNIAASTSDFASIGYDDAVVQNFSQILGAEIKPVEAIPRLAPSLLEPPTLELKPLPENLKYAFLAPNEKLPVIIAKDLLPEQEEKLLSILKHNIKAIGWTLADIPGISPSTCMHKIQMEEGVKPVRQPQRRLNPLILDVVRKEVSKLLAAGIIYPISDSKWVSPVQVVPKKTGITVVKNSKDELVPTRVQNSWRVCIDYRKLNQATRKDHFPLPFIDQMLERLAGQSHYCFLDGFSGYFQIHIAPEDQEKTTFTCPFGTFAYRRMPFGLCNAPGTFQRCMVSIFSDFLEDCMEVFMDDFTVYGSSFDACLDSLAKVLNRCIEAHLVLNFEKCHFMVKQGVVLGHIISSKGISVDRSKIDVIASLPYPTCVREVRSFLGHAGFYRRFI